METTWIILKPMLEHEYAMAVWGVMLLHVYKWFVFAGVCQRSNLGFGSLFKFWWFEWDDIGRSLVWVGLLIAMDDEVQDWYNDWAEEDIIVLTKEMYFVAGFFIDSIRKWATARFHFKTPKIDISLYKKEGDD